MKSFQHTQLAFTEYLRGNTSGDSANDKKSRQEEIYRDLIYKNISQCISDVFQTTKSIIPESEWEAMIREFIKIHPSHTPYFLEICQEFLAYFVNTRKLQPTDYPFIIELMHFEWIQLAIDIADLSLPETTCIPEPAESSLWNASPFVVGLTYSYPVHIIDKDYLPIEQTAQPTYLLVHRKRNDDLEILETDGLSLRIIQLLQAHEKINYSQIFQLLAEELDNHTKEILLPRVLSVLRTLAQDELIFCNQT
ncbi:DUF2063 domain-containing protein [Cellvibrio zantedeschiae]|uniref:DUF2063 domain-containing protein n=1 Tax=Cellvibrio zantedeschiae TaxID=1237077 RepID=A0ABQ3B4T7_9GAMM|nr:putative DNA-binding domain-containing protein [Cellvibrio zantedeschiae]GGY77031.1 DUF2063 domain-containing protein [Cellvibrio zantedeschiae]